MSEDTLVLWQTIRVPDTCQTHIDIDDSTGELVIEISGVGPAPVETTEPLNGKLVGGVIRSFPDRCMFINAVIEPT